MTQRPETGGVWYRDPVTGALSPDAGTPAVPAPEAPEAPIPEPAPEAAPPARSRKGR